MLDERIDARLMIGRFETARFRLGQPQSCVREIPAHNSLRIGLSRQIAPPIELLDQSFVAQPLQCGAGRNTARLEGAGNPRFAQHQPGRKAAVEQTFAQYDVDDLVERPRVGDAKLCRSLRKWTGDDATLMFDGSAGWDLTTSLKFGRVLEECGFYWYEEPMREFDLTSYRKLADSLDIPVLAAETSDGVHWNAATWIDMAALDMVRTSSFYKGGLTGALKIAHLAEAHGMKAEVHGMGTANAHLGAAIPNNDFYEQLVFSTEHIKGLRKQNELPIIDGFITVPETPGLGLDVDWAALEKTALAVI
jgi:L-alanine-DL-glutamate epimerase-like enolase superfamily enzyme